MPWKIRLPLLMVYLLGYQLTTNAAAVSLMKGQNLNCLWFSTIAAFNLVAVIYIVADFAAELVFEYQNNQKGEE